MTKEEVIAIKEQDQSVIDRYRNQIQENASNWSTRCIMQYYVEMQNRLIINRQLNQTELINEIVRRREIIMLIDNNMGLEINKRQAIKIMAKLLRQNQTDDAKYVKEKFDIVPTEEAILLVQLIKISSLEIIIKYKDDIKARVRDHSIVSALSIAIKNKLTIQEAMNIISDLEIDLSQEKNKIPEKMKISKEIYNEIIKDERVLITSFKNNQTHHTEEKIKELINKYPYKFV